MLSLRTAFAVTLLWTTLAMGQGQRSNDEPEEAPEPAPERGRRVAIGEVAPDLAAGAWENYEGTPTLAKFRDQIVVLFFFRTDDPSVDLLPALNDLNKNMNQLGVRVVGLTQQKKEEADTVIKGKQVGFIVGYDADIAERYKVVGLPMIYLLDTAGRLVDRFHPAQGLEEKVRAQLRKTPPAGANPKLLESRYRDAQSAMAAKEIGRAYTLARDVSRRADPQSDLGKKAPELIKAIQELARRAVDDAKSTGSGSDADKNIATLAEISVRFEGEDVGADALAELGKRMSADAKTKPQIRKAQENARGMQLNDEAAMHESAERFFEAIEFYRRVTEEFPNTDAAKAAEDAITRVTTDPKIQARIKERRAEDEAERWFDIAGRFAQVEMYDKAREYYQRVIDSKSAALADKARERMDKLPADQPEPKDDEPAAKK